MLSKQSGDIGKVELEYIIRDHSMEKFEERKRSSNKSSMRKMQLYDVPRIECTIYDEYYNMYEILKDDMTSVEVAIEAYKECGITPDIQPFRGGTDGCITKSQPLKTPNKKKKIIITPKNYNTNPFLKELPAGAYRRRYFMGRMVFDLMYLFEYP